MEHHREALKRGSVVGRDGKTHSMPLNNSKAALTALKEEMALCWAVEGFYEDAEQQAMHSQMTMTDKKLDDNNHCRYIAGGV